MGKFTLAVVAIYILYYSGNIIYDLFLKKQNTVKTDDEEVFAITEIASQEQPEIATVGIEDAENLNTPASFTPNIVTEESAGFNTEPDIDELRRRFEFEEALENFENGNENLKSIETEKAAPEKPTVEPVPPAIEKTAEEIQKENEKKFEEMVNLATTSVAVVNHNGVRNFKSALY